MKNSELQQRKDAVFARGLGNMLPNYIASANNAELFDEEGKRFIDFGTGIAVLNTGHNHPKVKQAVLAQLDKFTHTCLMVTPYASAVELAEQLTEIAPISDPCKAIFVTTGAEAVENAVKIARAATRRRGVIAFNGGFHGRTNMTMGLTGKILPYKSMFGPFPGDIYHMPFPIDFHDVAIEDATKAIEALFKSSIAAEDVAAIIIEPIQGEGGFYQAPPAFLKALRAICDKYGIVFIADEIQTGFGRTGKMFCMEHAGVEPDLMTMAKGIAGGYPLSAVVGRANIMDAPDPGGLGGTYAGSPVACAAANAVLEVIKEEQLITRANQIGDQFRQRLEQLQHRFVQHIGEIRQVGAMIAVELVQEGVASSPNATLPKELVLKCAELGLLILSCGTRGNVIRFLPALTMTDDIVQEGLDIFEAAFAELVS